MSLADETVNAIEGELSHRIYFPGLALDIRGLYDRHSADFNATEGTAIVSNRSHITVAYASVKDQIDSLEGATVRIYNPEFTDDTTEYLSFKAGIPRKYESQTVEMELEAIEEDESESSS